jgi:YHS domain-containing protein
MAYARHIDKRVKLTRTSQQPPIIFEESFQMAKDLVCGMDVDEKTAEHKSEFEGTTYYFCCPGCKSKFDKEPAKYISGDSHSGHHH